MFIRFKEDQDFYPHSFVAGDVAHVPRDVFCKKTVAHWIDNGIAEECEEVDATPAPVVEEIDTDLNEAILMVDALDDERED